MFERRADIGGRSLDYIRFGRGERNLIIIQGLSVRDVKGSGLSIAYMYRRFSKDFTVYLFDRRPVVEKEISIWDLCDDIRKAMDALGIETASILGVSQGGMIAMALGIKYPSRVGKMVLAVTSSRPNETLLRTVGSFAECAASEDHRTLNRKTLELLYTDRYLRRYRALMPLAIRLVRPRDFRRFGFLCSSILDFDCYGRLDEIGCPVLVIGASDDKITTVQASVEIARKLGCELYIYENYGHAVYEEASDFNDRVHGFLLREE